MAPNAKTKTYLCKRRHFIINLKKMVVNMVRKSHISENQTRFASSIDDNLDAFEMSDQTENKDMLENIKSNESQKISKFIDFLKSKYNKDKISIDMLYSTHNLTSFSIFVSKNEAWFAMSNVKTQKKTRKYFHFFNI
jgi:hypothetical protein